MSASCTLSALAQLAQARGGDEALCELDGTSISYRGLHAVVASLAETYRELPDSVGLSGRNGIAWVAAALALMAAGRTLVPLPAFFSRDQLAHVVADATIGHILSTDVADEAVNSFGVPLSGVALPAHRELTPPDTRSESRFRGRLVIYTSGSTGRPKGVCIGATQLAHSAKAIGEAIGAGPGDSYLSVLPLSLLLEQVCAIHAAQLAGARVVFGVAPTGEGLAALVERVKPTITVLVPQLLAAWVATLEAAGRTAPDALRLVAVGGAPVPVGLAASAWRCGIPVHEGYGLSECCSVVALNRPGARAPGTVGHPLEGLEVMLDEGEIVVRGATVMDGYLGGDGAGPAGVWRTGDLGGFDAAGRLIVHGRKDSMLVTAAGRNVVPEWIEAMVTADPRLAHCILIGRAQPALTAVIVPRDGHAERFDAMTPPRLEAHVARLLGSAPSYARPARCLLVPEAELRRRGLLTGNGRPRRGAIEEAFAPLPQCDQPDLRQFRQEEVPS